MTLAFPKPKDVEHKLTLSPDARRKKLDKFCEAQKMRCVTCQCRMTREPYRLNTATLGHRNPQPAGCAKDDSDDNLLGAQCFKCNAERGSKRG